MVVKPDKEPHYLAHYRKLAQRGGTRILEIGVQHGGSLALWQDLFPGALVCGVDISAACTWPEGTKRVVASQDDPRLWEYIRRECGSDSFDLIVDDASHLAELSEITWNRLWPLVRPGGAYVWEDWGTCVVNPDFYGRAHELLVSMATEVERRNASALDIRPGFMTLYRA